MMNLLSPLITRRGDVWTEGFKGVGTCRLHPLPPSLTQPQAITTSPTPMGKIINLHYGVGVSSRTRWTDTGTRIWILGGLVGQKYSFSSWVRLDPYRRASRSSFRFGIWPNSILSLLMILHNLYLEPTGSAVLKKAPMKVASNLIRLMTLKN